MSKNVKSIDNSNGNYGKIKNSSAMYVEAGFPQDGGKAPTVRKGGDLRSNTSKK